MRTALERTGRNALSRLLGIIFRVQSDNVGEVGRRIRSAAPPKILFIRPHQGLGDLLLATPVFRALKELIPGVQIHFLADPYNEVAIRDNKRLDRVWIWDKKRMQNPLRALSFLSALRRERFTAAIPLFSHVPSFTSFLLARLSGADFVISYETRSFYGGAPWSANLANVEIPALPDEEPEWNKFLGIIRPFLPASAGRLDVTPEYFLVQGDEEWAAAVWSRMIPADSRKKRIGLFLGGNPDRPERLWPMPYWAQLAARLQEDSDIELLAIVPPEDFRSGSRALERGIYAGVAARLKRPPTLFSNASLSRLAAFLKGLDLFVCVDGGLFHIAVASKVPTLGLFTKTDPARWAPPVPWQYVLRSKDEQSDSLLPDEVYHKIREMVLKSEKATP